MAPNIFIPACMVQILPLSEVKRAERGVLWTENAQLSCLPGYFSCSSHDREVFRPLTNAPNSVLVVRVIANNIFGPTTTTYYYSVAPPKLAHILHLICTSVLTSCF
jgi:hypothetical protein